MVISVKPYLVEKVLIEIKDLVNSDHLVVSIAAGVTIEQFQAVLGPDSKIVRIMPNTPCLVGCMAGGYTMGPGTDEADDELI